MFWNRSNRPFFIRQESAYPRVLIKTTHKEIEGYIEESNYDFLADRDKGFIIRSKGENPITGARVGTFFVTSIKEVEANDWYIKIAHNGEILYETKSNLLEIKLKDTESVPEVYYKGKRLDSMPCGLVDINYHYHTTGDRPDGANDIHINYYEGNDMKFPDLKTIGHKRMI